MQQTATTAIPVAEAQVKCDPTSKSWLVCEFRNRDSLKYSLDDALTLVQLKQSMFSSTAPIPSMLLLLDLCAVSARQYSSQKIFRGKKVFNSQIVLNILAATTCKQQCEAPVTSSYSNMDAVRDTFNLARTLLHFSRNIDLPYFFLHRLNSVSSVSEVFRPVTSPRRFYQKRITRYPFQGIVDILMNPIAMQSTCTYACPTGFSLTVNVRIFFL